MDGKKKFNKNACSNAHLNPTGLQCKFAEKATNIDSVNASESDAIINMVSDASKTQSEDNSVLSAIKSVGIRHISGY